jgi:hypothetical protein
MPFVVKAAVEPGAGTEVLTFHEKTMYRGKEVDVGDEAFVFASENQGGHGLYLRGTVTSVERGPGVRVTIDVRPSATATRPLGRTELRAYRDLDDDQPQSEVARKLYRQATNKVARVSDETAAFLRTYF